MPHSYSINLIHCVFATKGRRPLIPDAHQPRLARYLATVAQTEGAHLIECGGIADHVHLLLDVPPKLGLAELIAKLKANSSRWIKAEVGDFAWQAGYGAFSVSPSRAEAVRAYIRNQAEHHRKRTFEEEFAEFLKAAGVEFDPANMFGE